MSTVYKTKEEVYTQAKKILNKSLREFVPADSIEDIEDVIEKYRGRKKGLLGDLIEVYLFDKEPDNVSEADFNIAGVELKTNPIKEHPTKKYISKERLVFSMIDYEKIVEEVWETSSFLKKNQILLLMFYLFLSTVSIIDYEFKFIKLLDLLKDISSDDVLQIKRDWEFIVKKIKRGEAHLLSEGDTYYLGACTKAQNSSVVRGQPGSDIKAKPRAFSLKQQYLNYLIQKDLLGNDLEAESILNKNLSKDRGPRTIEEVFGEKFRPFINKTDTEILKLLNTTLGKEPKNYKRLLVNKMLGVSSNKVEELEKANVVLKVITLESSGSLTESISFPAFDYRDIVGQVWDDDDDEKMSDLHTLLETNKFLFVIFQKIDSSDDIVLKKTMFWNFPMNDIEEAHRVWEKTKECIVSGHYLELPKITDSPVIHVRPHGKDASDTMLTPQGTQEVKRCFWLNAKYIQKAIGKL